MIVPIGDLVAARCKNTILDEQIVLGIIYVESKGEPEASRFEQKFFDKYVAPYLRPEMKGHVPHPGIVDHPTERIYRATSLGLMQIMGQVAREMGYSEDHLTRLLNPVLGIYWGCEFLLSTHIHLGKDWTSTLVRYNGSKKYPALVQAAIKDGHHLKIAKKQVNTCDHQVFFS